MWLRLFLADVNITSGDPTKFAESWRFWVVIMLPLATTRLVGGDSCLPGFYRNGTEDQPLDCVPCSVCGAGHGTAAPCGGYNDTQCAECPQGQFSRLTYGGRECTLCESCTPERTVASLCTPTQDSICGLCNRGYFLYVDNNSSECLRCSKCPTDSAALHWLECAGAGEPIANQCAPGVWSDPGYHTTVPTVQPTTTIRFAVKTRLPTDHGMFVPMASYKSKVQNLPDENKISMYIGIVAIVFTVATAIAFINTTICCLFREGRSRRNRKNTKGARHPIQVEDDSIL